MSYNLITTFDIETNGLRFEVDKFHCLAYSIDTEDGKHVKHGTFTNLNDSISFLNDQEVILGHNIITYDIPVLQDLSGKEIIIENKIDTLSLSWYLFQRMKSGKEFINRPLHGLDYWGDILGIKKPFISDWENQTLKDYLVRCLTDVKINRKFWFDKCKPLLNKLYNEVGNNDIYRIVNYLNYKMECLNEQEDNPLTIDIKNCSTNLEKVNIQIAEKADILADKMPLVPKKVKYKKPKVMFKTDGSLSAHGIKWISRFDSKEESEKYDEIEVVKEYVSPNPNSPDQLKSWLFDLGWKPEIYKDSFSKVTQTYNKVPQLYDDKKKVCSSIRKLYDKHPYLKELDSLGMLKHRKGVFEGFLSENVDSKIIASAGGFTNTLRFTHRKPFTNLVKTSKPYGKEIRGSIIAPKDMILCGADMSALEDTTKQHYMYYFDPDYVNEMRVPGFDPHLDISILAQMMTKEEAEEYKRLKDILENDGKLTDEEHHEFESLDEIRADSKTVNFGGIYGAGPAKIDETLKKGYAFCKNLHTIYWERNKAVKIVERNAHYKEVDGQLWLYNPVSKFWYNLRNTKDIFSVLNQSTGVYCFDTWTRIIRKSELINLSLQYHDELGFYLIDNQEMKDKIRSILNDSVVRLNKIIKLNVPLNISAKFGYNYAETH